MFSNSQNREYKDVKNMFRGILLASSRRVFQIVVYTELLKNRFWIGPYYFVE